MSKYSYLNLNQKMIKIRKKIPALIRKRYSEDVDYDFVKLDDINQFLTPALNRYGVDFDIQEETPTQTDASGNLVFLTQEGNLWRYEANLGICWTNADHPEEKITSVIHLVGTNDIADKAKGTAMTYGLKYYLLNKFNIPQSGEEDPDMRGTGNIEGAQREKEAPKEKGKKTEKKGTKTVKSGKETGYHPTDGLEEGLKEGPASSGGGDTENKPVRNGNAVSAGKAKGVSGGEQRSKIQPIKEAAPDKEETRPDKGEKEALQGEGQISFLGAEEMLSEKGEGTPAEVKEEESQEETEFTDEEEKGDSKEEADDPGDGFRNVKEDDDVPFSDPEDEYGEGEEKDDSEEPEGENGAQDDDKVEKAKAVICNFGLYKGKTLGQMLDTQKGWESLKWIAGRYMGANKEMKEAAAILVEAGAYAPKAA